MCDYRAAEYRSQQCLLVSLRIHPAQIADDVVPTCAICQVSSDLRTLYVTGESVSSSSDGAEDCDQITSTTSGLLRAFIADHCDFLVNQDGWISRAEELDLPLNPLDELIDELGMYDSLIAQTREEVL